ncbi:MAG: hypothetical protein ACREQQ_00675, partial [Candidatus Binatia bacterium]
MNVGEEERKRSTVWERTLLVMAGALFAAHVWRYHDYLIDDAFISFRYARNLISGHGLVYNPGERVEGYTDFLFVVLSAGLMKLGIDPLVGTRLVSFAFALVTLGLVAYLERPAGAGKAATGLLLSLPAFAYWSAATFETMMFTGLVTGAIALTVLEARDGRLRGAAIAFTLAALTRPEGVFLFAATTAAFAVTELLVSRSLFPLRRHARSVALFAVLFGAYFTWRYSYYGHLLPNTFYAKVTGGEGQLTSGLVYLWKSTIAAPPLALGLLLPLGFFAARRIEWPAHWRSGAIYLVLVCYVVYAVGIGGDSMAFARFFVPMLPLCCLLVSWTIRAALPIGWRKRALGGAFFLNFVPLL